MQLGKAVSILMAHERQADAYLHAFHAPSECYGDVSKGLARDFRLVRKHACRVARVKNLQQLRKKLKQVCPTWDRYNHFKLGVEGI